MSFFIAACSSTQRLKTDHAQTVVVAERSKDPSELYRELFSAVQSAPVFQDSKTFVDMTPKDDPEKIMKAFVTEKPKTRAELEAFVETHFASLPKPESLEAKATGGPKSKPSVASHIKALWKDLRRPADVEGLADSSLIPLPYPYVVPGGRFREIYYWDSYFTQLGLLADGETQLFRDTVKNFSHLLMSVGRIPNGNRDYYRSRSQPPFFSYMVALWQEHLGAESAIMFLPALKKEHEFWMSGGRAVKLGENEILNRYWDDRDTPRPEAYKEDTALAFKAFSETKRPPQEIFRDLRAGAESGWDYSTRWFKDPDKFTTIETTAYLPIDLNSLLYHLEIRISDLAKRSGDFETSKRFSQFAERRRSLIQSLLWDEASGTFRDFNWQTQKRSTEVTIAQAVALFSGVANERQAALVAKSIEKNFLKAGGVVTTLRNSGQQWDSPNGWAPHQWMTYAGLKRFGSDALAEKVRTRWLRLNARVYSSTGKLMEKYNVIDLNLKSGGGEYETQDGFGWTNGVYRAFETPKASTQHLF